jgi:hypothetical protein
MAMSWPKKTDPEQQQLDQDLRRLLQRTAPPEPHPAVWTSLFAQIERQARGEGQVTRSGLASRLSSLTPWLAASAAVAAALLVALLIELGRTPQVANVGPVAPTGAEAFPVASAAEIEILSVAGADTHTLVVGNPPLDGTLELLEPGDVSLFSVEPAADDMVPEFRFHGPNAPMIWAHLDE